MINTCNETFGSSIGKHLEYLFWEQEVQKLTTKRSHFSLENQHNLNRKSNSWGPTEHMGYSNKESLSFSVLTQHLTEKKEEYLKVKIWKPAHNIMFSQAAVVDAHLF